MSVKSRPYISIWEANPNPNPLVISELRDGSSWDESHQQTVMDDDCSLVRNKSMHSSIHMNEWTINTTIANHNHRVFQGAGGIDTNTLVT